MSKKHQHKASRKKTRTGQDRKNRRKTGQYLQQFSGKSRNQIKKGK